MRKRTETVDSQELGLALGRAIARQRKKCEFTQDELAEKVGVDAETISRIERGVTLPSLSRLDQLAKSLDIGIAELLGQSSQIHGDQMRRLAELMGVLKTTDRTLLLGIAELLVHQTRK